MFLQMFENWKHFGHENEKLVSPLQKIKIQREIATDFYRKLRTVHVTAAVYIQKKYALNNPLLKSFCVLGSQWYIIQKHVTDSELPLSEEKERLDVWWNKVFKANRCPVLSSLVHPCLSIFTGLMMECSFSMMNYIIDSRSSRMEIETYR